MIHRIMNYLFKVKLRFSSAEKRSALMKNKFYRIGRNVKLYTLNFGTEPWLISIGDNVTVAADVTFVTHDVSCYHIARILNIGENSVDKIGSITLMDNCFIGTKTILMPNTSVGRNSIIAAGSIVTKDIPNNEVWGGAPARYIMDVSDYAKRVVDASKNYPWLQEKDLSVDEGKRIRQSYFFEKRN